MRLSQTTAAHEEKLNEVAAKLVQAEEEKRRTQRQLEKLTNKAKVDKSNQQSDKAKLQQYSDQISKLTQQLDDAQALCRTHSAESVKLSDEAKASGHKLQAVHKDYVALASKVHDLAQHALDVTRRLAAVSPYNKLDDLLYLTTTTSTCGENIVDDSDFSTKSPLELADQAKAHLVACLAGLTACAGDNDDPSYNFDADFE